jgi:hypothetical protein
MVRPKRPTHESASKPAFPRNNTASSEAQNKANFFILYSDRDQDFRFRSGRKIIRLIHSKKGQFFISYDDNYIFVFPDAYSKGL